jgi:hypothetical protein
MTLKAEQKDILLGLVSGLGSPSAEKAAIELARDDAEAAGFLGEMRVITRELRAFSEVPNSPPLPSSEVDRLTQAIVTRLDASRPRPQSKPKRRLRRWGAPIGALSSLALMACCLLVILWTGRQEDDRSAGRRVVLFPGTFNLGGGGHVVVQAHPGSIVQTRSGPGLIRLDERTTLVLAPHCVLEMGQRGEPVFLREGRLYVRSRGVTAVASPDASFDLTVGLAEIRVTPDYTLWRVFDGRGLLHAGRQSYAVTPHQQVLRELRGGAVSLFRDQPASLPEWAEQLFDNPSP